MKMNCLESFTIIGDRDLHPGTYSTAHAQSIVYLLWLFMVQCFIVDKKIGQLLASGLVFLQIFIIRFYLSLGLFTVSLRY